MVKSTLNVHIFEHRGSWYAFNPVTVHVVPLEPDEAAFLKAKADIDEPCVGSSLGWDPSRITTMKDTLSKKGLLSSSGSDPAPATPRREKVEILVNASQTCNLACEYCFVDEGKFNYDDSRVMHLSTDLAERLIHVLPEALPWVTEFCIHFYGGEPLLNVAAMRKAVEVAKAYNGLYTFAITTNGTIVSDEAISVLKDGKFSVVLSIDGPPHIHDGMRRTKNGEPTHDIVIKFLSLLREPPAVPVRGSAVIRKGWSLHEAEKYLNSLDVDLIKAQPVRLSEDHPLMLDKTERQQYITDLGKVADTVINNLKEGKAPKDDRFNQRVLQVLQRTKRTSFCGAGEWSFGVAADGTVLPCVLLAGVPGTVLGHIDDPPSTWVKQGKKWAHEHGPRTECASCWALPLCGGGCPAMLHVCGEDECVLTRAHCELSLAIYGEFLDNKVDLLYLAGIGE
ncbi:MAG: radical SAM protein [Candidatus Methanofastidiosia archaeon]|jgi:uncharacterized protein